MEGIIEQTLWMCREVHIYRIPPRPGAGGWRSGEWRVGDKIFSGRLRVVALGDNCEVRIEDTNTNEIFAVCPVPFGKKAISVEPVTDSSRYFVLRVEDPATKRHAFLGLGFAERGDAFDFNVALADHEKHVQIARAAETVTAAGAAETSTSAPNMMNEAVASLYKHHGDLSLKEGQTIRINVKKTPKPASSSTSNAPVPLIPLPPPPGSSSAVPGLLPPPPSRTTSGPSASAWGPSQSPAWQTNGQEALPQQQPQQQVQPGLQAKVTTEWATFD